MAMVNSLSNGATGSSQSGGRGGGRGYAATFPAPNQAQNQYSETRASQIGHSGGGRGGRGGLEGRPSNNQHHQGSQCRKVEGKRYIDIFVDPNTGFESGSAGPERLRRPPRPPPFRRLEEARSTHPIPGLGSWIRAVHLGCSSYQ
ncbi:hypothetical protein IQ07DRAFT_604043 [Pyrenochaeta sp. DS3sAY3a]|nr:hypothetical protein IQ07DRAFT_604043 [Pyrenochaeta sp. DS3sAY3a]